MSFLSSDKSTGHRPAKSGGAIRETTGPITLFHNLRTQPLTFALACLGLLGVLGLKTLAVRARNREDSASAKR